MTNTFLALRDAVEEWGGRLSLTTFGDPRLHLILWAPRGTVWIATGESRIDIFGKRKMNQEHEWLPAMYAKAIRMAKMGTHPIVFPRRPCERLRPRL